MPMMIWSWATPAMSVVSTWLSKAIRIGALLVGETDHAIPALGGVRVDQHGVEALVDVVLDGAELGGHVGADRDDLELLDVLGDFRQRRIGLGGLDHLNAPDVGDEAVDHRDPVGAFLGRPLEVLGVGRPWHEALAGSSPGPDDDLRARGERQARHQADG